MRVPATPLECLTTNRISFERPNILKHLGSWACKYICMQLRYECKGACVGKVVDYRDKFLAEVHDRLGVEEETCIILGRAYFAD